jgi:type II secretory pathway component GspD/PulD (secretin)
MRMRVSESMSTSSTAFVLRARRQGGLGACAACLALAVAAAGCRAFAPTIAQRRADTVAQEVSLSELSELARQASEPPPRNPLPPREATAIKASTLRPRAPTPLPRIAGDEPIALEMPGIALEDALRMLAAAAGVNFYLDTVPDVTVDAVFPAITIDAALGLLLQRHGLTLSEEPAGVFSIRPDDPALVETTLWELQSVHAPDILENLKAIVSSTTTLVVDANQDFVMARGPRNELALISEYLLRSDRLKRQVLIEARILELTMDENFELGISNVIEDANSDPHTVSFLQQLATSSSQFSLIYDNATVPITTTLTALSRYSGLNLVSSPRLLVLHGKEAKIDVVTEIPYIQATSSTNVGGGSAGTATTEQVSFKEAGIKLTVTPLVQEGGVVQMKIHQELSEVVGTFNTVPVIEKRTIDTDFNVADGQTVVLGGLLENRSSEIDRGIPFLKDLPLLGRLFRSDEDSSKRRELLLLLTPRVLTPEQASSLAGAYAQSYSGKLASSGAPRGERF